MLFRLRGLQRRRTSASSSPQSAFAVQEYPMILSRRPDSNRNSTVPPLQLKLSPCQWQSTRLDSARKRRFPTFCNAVERFDMLESLTAISLKRSHVRTLAMIVASGRLSRGGISTGLVIAPIVRLCRGRILPTTSTDVGDESQTPEEEALLTSTPGAQSDRRASAEEVAASTCVHFKPQSRRISREITPTQKAGGGRALIQASTWWRWRRLAMATAWSTGPSDSRSPASRRTGWSTQHGEAQWSRDNRTALRSKITADHGPTCDRGMPSDLARPQLPATVRLGPRGWTESKR